VSRAPFRLSDTAAPVSRVSDQPALPAQPRTDCGFGVPAQRTNDLFVVGIRQIPCGSSASSVLSALKQWQSWFSTTSPPLAKRARFFELWGSADRVYNLLQILPRREGEAVVNVSWTNLELKVTLKR